MKYGNFSPDGKKYIVTNPVTPRPWVNLLTNQKLASYISLTGGGFSFLKETGEQVLKRGNDLTLSDRPGRYVFVRDNQTGKFWNIGWQPTKVALDNFKATFSSNNVLLESSFAEIDSSLEFLLDDNEPVEIWQLKLFNSSSAKKDLSIFVFCEPSLSDFEVKYDNLGVYLSTKNLSNFLALDKKIDSFDTDKEVFLGKYGDLSLPKAIVDGKLSRSLAEQNPVIVLQKNVSVGAKRSAEIKVFSGYLETSKIHSYLKKITEPEIIEKIAKNNLLNIEKPLSNIMLESPSQIIDRHFNCLKHQTLLNSQIDFEISYCQNTGKVEFSQLCQNVISSLPFVDDPKKALLDILKQQNRDGEVFAYLGTNYMVKSLIEYLAETGDKKIFKEVVEYKDGATGTVFEHLIKAIRQMFENLSVHHISQEILNDEKIESTASLFMLIDNLQKVIPILVEHDEHYFLGKCHHTLEKLIHAVDTRMWEGSYYLFGRLDNKKLGLKKSASGMFLLPQVLAAQVLKNNNSKKALLSAIKNLGDKVALKDFGESKLLDVSQTIEVYRALIKSDRGEKVVEALEELLDLQESSDIYKAEPFALAGLLNTSDSAKPYQAKNVWLNTGAGNLHKLITEDIVGVKPTFDGIKIEPFIPRDWRKVNLFRRFRGADYQIEIRNPLRHNHGINRILVDGQILVGNVIKPFSAGTHFIEVVLG